MDRQQILRRCVVLAVLGAVAAFWLAELRSGQRRREELPQEEMAPAFTNVYRPGPDGFLQRVHPREKAGGKL